MQLWTTSLLVYEQSTSRRAGPQRFSLCSNTRSDLGIQYRSEIALASSSLVIEDRSRPGRPYPPAARRMRAVMSGGSVNARPRRSASKKRGGS